MKNMNTMKHLAKRIVSLYMTKALVHKDIALRDFVQVCNQSEGVKGHKNLNEHGKFVSRFHNWWVGVADRPLSDMMALMDDFFEKENYNWEDLYVGSR
jgi:hypothetical protein